MGKVPIYIRIDKATVDWFREQSPSGYQTHMNAALGSFVQKSERKLCFVLGRAQEIFRQYHAKCFWHLKKDLVVTPSNLASIIAGLKKFGGREGYLLAAELEQSSKMVPPHAD